MSFDDVVFNEKETSKEFLVMEHLDLLVRYLTPNQYVALILSDVLQFKGSEVAEIMSSSEGAVHTNLSRARNKRCEYHNSNKKISYAHAVKELPINLTIDLLLKGFRDKNPKLIASLLDEKVMTDITHSGLEMGKNETEKNSLKDWAEIVQKQHKIVSQYIELWGRNVIIEFERKLDKKLYLNGIHAFKRNHLLFRHNEWYQNSWRYR
ncbi:hypothetical protein J19TS1_43130 [Heyndrickxia oleronia]|nr:hypothetical protein J19TS1_43130 [Heyndrickxia oleronia]